MTLVHRVLHAQPTMSFEDHLTRRRGELEAATRTDPLEIIETSALSGLRGRRA